MTRPFRPWTLLHGLMIRSGNDASLVLADYVCNGDINQFVEMMNQKAQELGCQDTHFTNPHGLHDENHYTTARDLYLITKYAMTLPNFMEISSKVSYVLPATNKQETRRITTTNHLINQNAEGNYYYMYAKGIKTGAHDQAGYCLVSTAIRNGYSYMCVALGAPSVDEKRELHLRPRRNARQQEPVPVGIFGSGDEDHRFRRRTP